MDYGVVMFPTEYAIAPDELARALEERGFESVWFPEHTHIPASRRSPWPGGGELPREYWSAYDPFVALMAAAAHLIVRVSGDLYTAMTVHFVYDFFAGLVILRLARRDGTLPAKLPA